MAIQLTATGDPISSSQLDQLELALKTKLPEDYRDFLLRNNGAIPEENAYKAQQVTTGVTLFFGVSQDKNRDLVTQNRIVYAERLPPRSIAIAAAGGGNLVCLRTSDGGIYFWDHEREAVDDEQPNFTNMTRLAQSFTEFLDRLEPYRAVDFDQSQARVTSVRLKPGFQEKFKKYM